MATLCSITNAQEKVSTWPLNLSVGKGGFYASVRYYFGYNHLRRSVLQGPEEEYRFRTCLRMPDPPIKCALEIGTYKGTATALLANYAEKVYTIDKYNYVDKYPFWMEYDVYQKIYSYVIDSEEDKAQLINNLDFDFAFIDGNHTEEGVQSDFDCVKKCGRVLFHDYYEDPNQGIMPVVKKLALTDPVTINGTYAYWERRDLLEAAVRKADPSGACANR